MQSCHLTCTTKKKVNVLRYILKAAKYEKQKPVSRISPLKRDDGMFDTKTLNLAEVSGFSLCVIKIVVANSRERVYFERQILALLLIHQTHNLSRIKFAHISRQVEGLCIS